MFDRRLLSHSATATAHVVRLSSCCPRQLACAACLNSTGAHKRSRACTACRAEGGHRDAESTASPPEAPFSSEADLAQEPRDDDVLPDSLGDALQQAGEATNAALGRGTTRCLVEILLPEFWDPVSGAVFAEEGDQLRFWKLTRRFVESLEDCEPGRRIRLVYPDSGVAALLKNSWRDIGYGMSSLTDRRPVEAGDELIIVAAPDPQGLDMCKKIAGDLEDQRPMILFNPRLASGDVGIGLNIRRMRSRFLSTFTTTYSLRPVGDVGSVFRRYPEMWQIFVVDNERAGRFRLVKEQSSRPAGESLDLIIMDALGSQEPQGDGDGRSLLGQLQNTIQSLQRFAKQLSQ